jgi:predicted TIM-barrel fold metal-dependent hydrolase
MRADVVDVNTFVGAYPFRHVPHPDAASLVSVMKREGIGRALVGYLPAAWHRSPGDANRELARSLEEHGHHLVPVPVVNPSWPGWQRDLEAVARSAAVAVRVYPPQWGGTCTAAALAELCAACAEQELTVILTTRFEDARQRHWMDSAGDLQAGVVRDMVRSHSRVRVVLTCAGRSLIEEIHWALTPAERDRLWYDISWIWGPPQNDLAHLVATLGGSRLLFGSMWPLRLVQVPIANLELVAGAVELGTADAAFPRLKLQG